MPVITWVKVLPMLGCFLAGVMAGGGIVQYRWTVDKLERSEADAAANAAFAARLKEMQDAKDVAMVERDNALHDLSDMDAVNRGLLERVRRYAAEHPAGAVPDNPAGACVRQLGQCKRHLAEGAEVVSECSRMVGSLNADRNAVRKIAK
jgi:hypothetical protein